MALTPEAAAAVADMDAWAAAHSYLIKSAWQQMVATGEWPDAESLTRAFFRTRRVDVHVVAAQMPPALGRLEAGRVILTVRGASYCSAAKRDLRLYIAVVVEAVRRYGGGADQPGVGERELAAVGIAAERQPVFERILEGERWALLHQYDNDGRPVYAPNPSAALTLARVKTLPKYLEAQANTHWLHMRPPPINPLLHLEAAPEATAAAPEGLDWLHPEVRAAAGELLAQGHHREAVGRALMVLMDELRRLAGSNKDGKTLVNLAFSEKRPRVVIADRRSESGQSLQRGTHLLFQGLVAAIRNPSAHRAVELEWVEAVEQLALISFLHRQLDVTSARRERARHKAGGA
jgi:uncharacterized protein (TIGR02391 family)